jgi:hypothetical protein
MSRIDSRVIDELEKMYPSINLDSVLGNDEKYYLSLVNNDKQGFKGEKAEGQRALRILAKYDEIKKRKDEERRAKQEEETKVLRAEQAARKAAREAKMKEKAERDASEAKEAERRKMESKSAEAAFRDYEESKKAKKAEATAIVDDVTKMFQAGKEAAGGGSAEPVKKSIKEKVMEKKINEYMKTISGAELSDFMKLDPEMQNRRINIKKLQAKNRIAERKEEEQKAVMVEQPRVTKVIKKSFSLKNSSPDASSVRDISDAVSKRTKEHVAGLPIYGMKSIAE